MSSGGGVSLCPGRAMDWSVEAKSEELEQRRLRVQQHVVFAGRGIGMLASRGDAQ